MKTLKHTLITVFIFSVVVLAGCGSKGSEFLGTWVNAKDASDTFQVIRNGDQYLIVGKASKIGATYEKGTLEIKGALISTDLTYDRNTDTILAPGFFGQVEYKRKR
jgi:hypothetical protein